MRVKILRWTDPTSSQVLLRVCRWCDGQWEKVLDFSLTEAEQANEFASKLSLSKRIPTEMATYEDGEKVIPTPPIVAVPLAIQQLEKQP